MVRPAFLCLAFAHGTLEQSMTGPTLASGVLLVGSIPLSSNEEVFTKLCNALPGRMVAITDGETGTRSNYIGWETQRFPKETLEPFIGGVPLPEGHSRVFTQEDVTPTEYDSAAKESYQKFVELREKGIIPPGMRFQVCLPAPLASIQGHLRSEFQAQLEPFYERRMLDALKSILDSIPSEDLAIQIDLCFEIIALEYDRGRLVQSSFFNAEFFKPHFSPIRQGLLDRVQRFCSDIPVAVPLGFHLCYGDLGHQHFLEPEDLALSVDFANDVARVIAPHRMSWLHVPVPKNRTDKSYFKPLERLNVGDGTKLYLGLVHANDEEGTRQRIQVAQTVVQDFGVATECGMGRTPMEELVSILQISRDVTSKS